jgi:hypothetical protein
LYKRLANDIMKVENYIQQKSRLPINGQNIIGKIENDTIIVYQAFNNSIADYAITNQCFGGNAYSFNRMSWIKPGFLWMMHRCGWSNKDQQERVLAITIPISILKNILNNAVFSSYKPALYKSIEDWKKALSNSDTRLQWDPDHDPFGTKQNRKAIQIGMKGETLKKFCTEWIVNIEDITEFVKSAYEKIKEKKVHLLELPYEEIVHLNDAALEKKIGINSICENAY